MARIISPTAYLAAVTAMLVSGTILGLPINIVRADDNCLTAPGAAPSEGQHWYYRTDRVNHRKCWYLHATVPLPNHTAAEPSAAASQPVLPAAPPQSPSAAAPQQTNAASAPDTAADTSKDVPSTADSTQPAPHVTVLTVKTVTVPSVATTSTPAAIEQTNEPPMPQTSAGDGKRPVEEHTKPVRAVDPATMPAAPETAENATKPAHSAPSDPGRMQPAYLFLLLALALGITAALIALVGRMADPTRTPRLSGDHGNDPRRYRATVQRGDEAVIHDEDAPFLAPQEPREPADLEAQEAPPAQADSPTIRPEAGEPEESEHVGPTLQDIQQALRLLQQARRDITRTRT